LAFLSVVLAGLLVLGIILLLVATILRQRKLAPVLPGVTEETFVGRLIPVVAFERDSAIFYGKGHTLDFGSVPCSRRIGRSARWCS